MDSNVSLESVFNVARTQTANLDTHVMLECVKIIALDTNVESPLYVSMESIVVPMIHLVEIYVQVQRTALDHALVVSMDTVHASKEFSMTNV